MGSEEYGECGVWGVRSMGGGEWGVGSGEWGVGSVGGGYGEYGECGKYG